MEVDPTRMCELLVGLPDVTVLAVIDAPGEPLRVAIETRDSRPSCASCAGVVVVKDRPTVELVDLACFGRAARLRRRGVRTLERCVARSWLGDREPASFAR